MSGRRLLRSGPGERADARLLLAERVHALRQLPYELLSIRAELHGELEHVVGLDGDRFHRRTRIRRFRRWGADELQILIQVHRPWALGRLSPLAEELLVATPDGRMQRHWTLPAELQVGRRARHGRHARR